MRKKEILELIEKAKLIAENEVKKTDDEMVKAAFDALLKNEEKIQIVWPLKETDRQTYLGLHATRNLLPDFQNLADCLMEIDYLIRNPELNEVPKI